MSGVGPRARRAPRPLALAERHPLVVLLVLAGLVRLPFLGVAEPDLDESWSWQFTRGVLASGGLWGSLSAGLDAPLFAGINQLVARGFGLSILGLRLPAALFGTLSVPLGYLLLRRLIAPRLAFLASLLAALSPFLVFYSMQARPYAQLLFFATLYAWVFFASELVRPLARNLALGACSLLAVASHYFALVHFAAFYTVVLGAHALAGRRRELRRDLLAGLVSLLAASPLLPLLARGLGGLSGSYWRLGELTLTGVLSEQLLFLGTTLPPRNVPAIGLDLAVVGWLLLPFAALAARRAWPALPPAVVWLGFAAPGGVAVLELLVGGDLLFYPRGFIASTPFLLAAWVAMVAAWPIGRRRKAAYVMVLGVPFALSGIAAATARPGHAYYRDREAPREIALAAHARRDRFDVLLVHHWWLAQAFAYHYPDAWRVQGLGAQRRALAAREGEAAAAVADVASVPAELRVLLLLNDVAGELDPGAAVVEALRAERALLWEGPCRPDPLPGEGLFCRRMLLFGAAERDQEADPRRGGRRRKRSPRAPRTARRTPRGRREAASRSRRWGSAR